MGPIYIAILILPIALNIKEGAAVVVFLSMNSVISILMEYTKVHIAIAFNQGKYDSRMQEMIDEGLSFEEGFEEYISNIDMEEGAEHIPKLILHAALVSKVVAVIAIVVGIVRWAM